MNSTLNDILERSSARKYRSEHIKDEDLELIIKAGLKAPSANNKQRPRFIVVRNEEIRNILMKKNAEFAGAPEGFDPFYGARDVIAVVGVKDGEWIPDCSLAIGNMLNAAHALGLSARWINRARQVFYTDEGKEVLKAAGITEEVEGVGFCIVGYPDEPLAPKDIIPGRVFYLD